MKQQIQAIDLDLTFSAAPENLWGPNLDSPTKQRLCQADVWEKDLENWIQALRKNLNLACPEIVREASCISLGLELSDDETLKRLNSIWRKNDTKTDVLSFPALEETFPVSQGTCVELGDIIVSVPTAKLQAKEYKHDLTSELQWLVTHGLLHLLGWNHPNEQSLKQMLACQEQLLGIKSNVQHHSDKTDR